MTTPSNTPRRRKKSPQAENTSPASIAGVAALRALAVKTVADVAGSSAVAEADRHVKAASAIMNEVIRQRADFEEMYGRAARAKEDKAVFHRSLGEALAHLIDMGEARGEVRAIVSGVPFR